MLGSIQEMFQDLSVSSAVSTFPVWQRHKSPALKKKKRKGWKKTGPGGFPSLIHGFLWGTVCPFHIVDVSPPCPFSPFFPLLFFKLSASFFFGEVVSRLYLHYFLAPGSARTDYICTERRNKAGRRTHTVAWGLNSKTANLSNIWKRRTQDAHHTLYFAGASRMLNWVVAICSPG